MKEVEPETSGENGKLGRRLRVYERRRNHPLLNWRGKVVDCGAVKP